DPVPCQYGHGKCIAKFINSLFSKRSGEADPALNLRRLDPLLVHRMSIDQPSNNGVGITLNFTDNLIYGIKDVRIVGVKGFGKDLTEEHALKMVAKSISLVGPYTIKGNILILPISGSGDSNITMILKLSGKPLVKDGETYLDVTDLKFSLKPAATSFAFTNLFNGDKALGDNMNAFLNENSEIIYQETSASINKAFEQVYLELIKGVFAHRPYAKLFAE
ncbi:hypothetical protein KR032_005357, partial [Drosophila birchii]